MRQVAARIDQFFGVSRHNTSFGRELRAGFTTFLTMAYILFVNPSILSKAIPLADTNGFAQLLSATALAAAVGTLIMGIIGRFPFATAPGMGLNAFFTFTIVQTQGVPWQTALGCVFLSGLIALAVSASGLREAIIRAFPLSIKRATAAGIGIFLAMIGFENSGIIVDSPSTLVQLGSLQAAGPLISFSGLIIMAALFARRVPGAIVIGILTSTAIAALSGAAVYQGQAFQGFSHGIIASPVWPSDLFFQLDIKGALQASLLVTILSLWFVDFFDTAGTLVGLAERAGYTDKRGNLPNGARAFVCDSLATAAGALIGTTSTTTYIESMAGIEDGGRTGLTSVTVAILFLLSLCLWPLASVIPAVATAPALIIVGALMMESAARIEWHEFRIAVPALLTMIGIPLTYSIAHGISFGIIAYTLVHALSGRTRDVPWFMYILSGLLALKLYYMS